MRVNLHFKNFCNKLVDGAGSVCLCPTCKLDGEHIDQLIETRYHTFDVEGNENEEWETAYDTTKSNLSNLTIGNNHGATALKVEESLLKRFGISVEYSASPARAQILSRNNPLPWEHFRMIGFEAVKVPGVDKTFLQDQAEPTNVAQHIRDTETYNSLVKHAFRTNILVETIGLMNEIMGFFKSPIEGRINPNFECVKRQIGPNDSLTSEKLAKLIRKIDCDLIKWSDSIIDENGTELFRFINWLFETAATFQRDLRLDEPRFWKDEIGEPTQYTRNLWTYTEMIRLGAAVQSKALKATWGHLRRTTSDLAHVVQTTINKYE